VPMIYEVAAFVCEQTSAQIPVTEQTTLQGDIGVVGDDLWAFIDAYAERFGVDVSGFRWYFHSPAEGSAGLGGLFFPPPNARVQEIPITVHMLHRFAELGHWAVEYPPHHVPRYRPGLWINLAVLAVALSVFGCALAASVRSCSARLASPDRAATSDRRSP
jgi:Protein of unknown function (DUF1493)